MMMPPAAQHADRPREDRGPSAGTCELLVVGYHGGTHVGGSFEAAARALGVSVGFRDMREAYDAPRWLAVFNWHLRHRRPTWLHWFGRAVVEECRRYRPRWLLATGLPPLTADALKAVGGLGVRRLLFSTDDPWNRLHSTAFHLPALTEFDVVFTPRRANVADFRRHGCRSVRYLPFAYDPELFFPEDPGPEERRRLASEVLFVGTADRDRAPFIRALVAGGVRVAVYGRYWDRYGLPPECVRGVAGPAELRRATAAAAIALCLVRRPNRDGHVMRSFEIPAVGACMLAEDTPEHREIFGPDDQAVAYFRDVETMLAGVRRLLADPPERGRLAAAAQRVILGGRNTYRDRLAAMLSDP